MSEPNEAKKGAEAEPREGESPGAPEADDPPGPPLTWLMEGSERKEIRNEDD